MAQKKIAIRVNTNSFVQNVRSGEELEPEMITEWNIKRILFAAIALLLSMLAIISYLTTSNLVVSPVAEGSEQVLDGGLPGVAQSNHDLSKPKNTRNTAPIVSAHTLQSGQQQVEKLQPKVSSLAVPFATTKVLVPHANDSIDAIQITTENLQQNTAQSVVLDKPLAQKKPTVVTMVDIGADNRKGSNQLRTTASSAVVAKPLSDASVEHTQLPKAQTNNAKNQVITGIDSLESVADTIETRSVPTSVHVNNVAQAVLVEKVISRKPQGVAVESICTRPDRAVSLTFFTELHGMTGKKITYRWLRNGKLMHQRTRKVKAKKWRSYSSKMFSLEMIGDWRVELRDENAQLLAGDLFQVLPPLQQAAKQADSSEL